MKSIFSIIILLSLVACTKAPISVATQEVEASCGLCHFGLPATECKLAVRIDGNAYFVKGVEIKNHEEMHKEGGYCTMIRTAKTSGRIENDIFVVADYKLLPLEN